MTVVVKREYTPIPKGIYNLRVESYEEKEKQDKSGSFFSWKISIIDPLPSDYSGRNFFNINTATDLTPGNNLNKFLNRVGMEEVPVGQGVDLDLIVGQVFVGNVIVKKGKNDRVVNDLGDITIPEYNRWLASQNETTPQSTPVTKTPTAVPKSVPTTTVRQNAAPTAHRPTTPVTTPKVGGTTPAFRPNATKPTTRVATPIQSEPEASEEGVEDTSVDDFPE